MDATGMFEECADDLNDLLMTMRYPPDVLAHALRFHLTALVLALGMHGVWSQAEVGRFLQDLCEQTVTRPL